MIRKTFKYFSIVLSVFSLITLWFPAFSTRITDGESWNMVVRGYNLAEFSPWGSIVLLTPIVLILLVLSKLGNSLKTISLFTLCLIDGFALCDSLSKSYSWMTENTTGHVTVHGYQLIYAVLLLMAIIYLFIDCNFDLEGRLIKDFFIKKEIDVDPIDYTKEKFFLCSKLYKLAKYKENGDEVNSKCAICFASSEGYFAAPNDNDSAEYLSVEVLGEDTAIGFVMKNMPTGIFGRFYEDFDFRKEIEMKIKEYPYIKKGKAEIWAPSEDGFVKLPAQISPLDIDDVKLKIDDALSREDMIGSVVVQDNELVAIVTDYDSETKEYKCIAAELMAIDLCRKIYE